MSLARNTVNPMSLIGCRKLGFIPRHFAKTQFVVSNSSKAVQAIDQWINMSLNERYAILSYVSRDDFSKTNIIVGFENPGELTMFMLGCPQFINKKG